MMKISSAELKNNCKALSVLEAILCQEWEYRYYSYNSKWDKGEECFEMRNGEGEQLLILFKGSDAIINGFSLEKPPINNDKNVIPERFHEFIFNDPIKTIGTTFCLWTDEDGGWNKEQLSTLGAVEEHALDIYFDSITKYIDWSYDYYELEEKLDYDVVKRIFESDSLDEMLIRKINPELSDFDLLKDDLDTIDYPYSF